MKTKQDTLPPATPAEPKQLTDGATAEACTAVPSMAAEGGSVRRILEDAFAADAGAGMEDFSAGDFAIPFLQILQTNSPQVKEGDGKFIEGAKAGMLYNTVTGKLYDVACRPNKAEPTGLLVVPAANKDAVVEWIPRDDGGGFVAQHDMDSEIVLNAKHDEKHRGRKITADGNHLVDTVYRYVVLDTPEGIQWAVISFTSTQLKKARVWASLIAGRTITLKSGQKVKPPMYGQMFTLKTVYEQNEQGSWYGWKIEPAGLVTESPNGSELYNAGKAFREAILSGRAKATPPTDDAAEGEGKEIPF